MKKKRKRLSAGHYNDNMSSYYREAMFLESLDADLKEYFTDTRLQSRKTSKRKKNSNFNIGDQVEAKNSFGTIIFGPYRSENGKDTYEIETEDGGIITAEDDGESIKAYVPPVEKEEEEEDLF